jgi:hypothetical protein
LNLPTGGNAVKLFGQEPFAFLSRQLQDIQRGPLFHIAETRGSANAVPFHRAMEDSGYRILQEPYIFAERLLLRLREALAAL